MSDDNLKIAAAALARAAPALWKEFVVAFGSHAANRTKECVQSQLAELPRAQGRAQEATSLFDLFGNAVKHADRVSDRRERRSN